MTPEQQDALDNHIDAIAKILYADTDPETLTTLADIERTVRDKMLEHVSPQVGIFYPQCYRNDGRENANRKELSRRPATQ